MSDTPATRGPAPPRTQTEAETYQRLRAHLAFLKLADAAEALPSGSFRDLGVGCGVSAGGGRFPGRWGV